MFPQLILYEAILICEEGSWGSEKTLIQRVNNLLNRKDKWGYEILPKKFSENIQNALDLLDDAMEEDLERAQNNMAAVAHNKEIYLSIVNGLKEIGLPDHEVTYVNPKTGRKTKRAYSISIWSQGLHKAFDKLHVAGSHLTVDQVARRYGELRSKCNEALAEASKSVAIAERAQAALKEEADDNKTIVIIGLKYFDANEDWNLQSLMNAILDKDPYLRLAHHMYEVRREFVYGPSHVMWALDRLPEQADKELVKDISETASYWDGDGRIFRDCNYNYNYIFEHYVDSDIFEDYDTIRAIVERRSY